MVDTWLTKWAMCMGRRCSRPLACPTCPRLEWCCLGCSHRRMAGAARAWVGLAWGVGCLRLTVWALLPTCGLHCHLGWGIRRADSSRCLWCTSGTDRWGHTGIWGGVRRACHPVDSMAAVAAGRVATRRHNGAAAVGGVSISPRTA